MNEIINKTIKIEALVQIPNFYKIIFLNKTGSDDS